MVPTSLPDLPKPSRTPKKSQKPQFLNQFFFRKFLGKIFTFLINPFLVGRPPEMDRGGVPSIS